MTWDHIGLMYVAMCAVVMICVFCSSGGIKK